MTSAPLELFIRAQNSLDEILNQIAVDMGHFVATTNSVPKEYPYLALMQKMGMVAEELSDDAHGSNMAYSLTQDALDIYRRLKAEGFYRQNSLERNHSGKGIAR